MKNLSLCILLIILLQSNVFGVSSEDAEPRLQDCEYPMACFQQGKVIDTDAKGSPLFLTSMIEKNQINEARAAAEVTHDDFHGLKSYSGFLTVDKRYGSHMFFWYYPALISPKAPVILWLHGGPGDSGLFGLFAEHGPYIVDDDSRLGVRNVSWNLHHNILYIDNPVGSGFSFTNHESGLSRNLENVVFNLYEALSQFFKLFPQLENNKFYICGESYAGKFVTALAHSIKLQNDREGGMTINLKGIAVGNGLVNPLKQFNYQQDGYTVGFLDATNIYGKKESFKNIEDFVHYLIREGNHEVAYAAFKHLMEPRDKHHQSPFPSLVTTDFKHNFIDFLNRPEIRRALHVGDLEFYGKSNVDKHMDQDLFKSEDEHLVNLLEDDVRVLFYNGALDKIASYNATNEYLMGLNWSRADEFRRSPRKEWRVAGELAGYAKEGGNLKHVLVLNAGQHVPDDQPFWMWDLITAFTYAN
ncbi:venom serine carboxypeptidase-like [Trichogramma pretiosum]|uniref:venom serine carboxypeptidase-like n=1 Tax=Trichogramma pretiosum TaxID=7493 RepID=UPI0006C95998|nr:venom serine carboxypeptidase-like [Trichogramma pretiosum]